MRSRFSAKSAASAPPAWALIEISASRASYWPFSSVRTSSWSISARRPALTVGLVFGGLVVLHLGQVEQHLGVAQALTQAGQPGQLGFKVGKPPGHLLRPILVSPQSGIGGLLAQVRCLPLHFARIKHSLDAVELRG